MSLDRLDQVFYKHPMSPVWFLKLTLVAVVLSLDREAAFKKNWNSLNIVEVHYLLTLDKSFHLKWESKTMEGIAKNSG